MAQQPSVGQMIMKLSGMVDTEELSTWENSFVKDICWHTDDGKSTTCLSGNQVEKVEQIHSKYF